VSIAIHGWSSLQVLTCEADGKLVKEAVRLLVSTIAQDTVAARAMLMVALPTLEASAGGPTHNTTFLRTSLGELCEALGDNTDAIGAYLSVTTTCAHMMPLEVSGM